MILSNNLSLFITNLMIVIFVLLFFKRLYPEKSYGVAEILQYLMITSFCITFVNCVHFILPFISQCSNNFYAIFIFAFFQIAFVEELAKYSGFLLLSSTKKELSPIDILFFSVCSSCSFIFIENLQYVQEIPLLCINKKEGFELLFKRFGTAALSHLADGFIVGYAVAYAKLNKKNMLLFSIIGILIATFFHGLYDVNIMLKINYLSEYKSKYFFLSFYSLLAFFVFICIYIFKKVGKLEKKYNGE